MHTNIEIVGDFNFIQIRLTDENGNHERYIKKPGEDFTGEPQEVLDARDEHHTPEVLAAYQQHLADEAAAAILTHEEYRTNGLRKVDDAHASFMRTLTGDATREEVDTWTAKVAASKIVVEANDTELTTLVNQVLTEDVQAIDDLETLVHDVGPELQDLRDLATVILTKSRAYKRLVGVASRIRREAKAGVTAATDEANPIEDVGAALDVVENTMLQAVQTAIAQWSGQ